MTKLLLLDLHHLGDAVMSLPFVNGASRDFEVTVCCRPSCAQVYSAARVPPRVVEWEPPWSDKRSSVSDAFSVLRTLRALRADLAVCVWPDARAHLAMKFAGAKRRVGFPMNAGNFYGMNAAWRRRQLRRGRIFSAGAAILTGGPLLTEPIQKTSTRQHHIESWRQLAEKIGVSIDVSVPWFEAGALRVPGAAREFIASQRAQGRAVWLVHAGGRLFTKRWPLERFREVIEKQLLAHGAAIVLIEPPGESVPDVTGERVMAARPSDLLELAGIVNQCDAVLCNDSVASHLAAACAKPAVVVFGSAEPAWFAPWGRGHEVVRADVCPHHPCLDRCVMPSVVCLEGVGADAVCDAVARMGERIAAE